MTDKPTPTDAEILDAAEDFRSHYTHGGTTFDEFDEIGFARAVLAKWGQPAQEAEPVARLEIESLKAQLHAAKQINAAQFGLLAASIPGSALRASHGQAPAGATLPDGWVQRRNPMTTEPTDAELNTILCTHWPAFAMQPTLVKIWVRDALQDAIDKWGRPVIAGDAVATQWLAEMIMSDCGCSTENQRLLDRIIDRIQQYDRANAAPQPVAREPLTDEWIRSRCIESWIFDTAIQWVRMTEAAHGIKGGQA